MSSSMTSSTTEAAVPAVAANDEAFEALVSMLLKKRPAHGSGVSQALMRSLPKLTVSDDLMKSLAMSGSFDPTVCAVCLETFPQDAQVVQLPCQHIYCAACIESWLSQRGACPICGKRVHDPHQSLGGSGPPLPVTSSSHNSSHGSLQTATSMLPGVTHVSSGGSAGRWESSLAVSSDRMDLGRSRVDGDEGGTANLPGDEDGGEDLGTSIHPGDLLFSDCKPTSRTVSFEVLERTLPPARATDLLHAAVTEAAAEQQDVTPPADTPPSSFDAHHPAYQAAFLPPAVMRIAPEGGAAHVASTRFPEPPHGNTDGADSSDISPQLRAVALSGSPVGGALRRRRLGSTSGRANPGSHEAPGALDRVASVITPTTGTASPVGLVPSLRSHDVSFPSAASSPRKKVQVVCPRDLETSGGDVVRAVDPAHRVAEPRRVAFVEVAPGLFRFQHREDEVVPATPTVPGTVGVVPRRSPSPEMESVMGRPRPSDADDDDPESALAATRWHDRVHNRIAAMHSSPSHRAVAAPTIVDVGTGHPTSTAGAARSQFHQYGLGASQLHQSGVQLHSSTAALGMSQKAVGETGGVAVGSGSNNIDSSGSTANSSTLQSATALLGVSSACFTGISFDRGEPAPSTVFYDGTTPGVSVSHAMLGTTHGGHVFAVDSARPPPPPPPPLGATAHHTGGHTGILSSESSVATSNASPGSVLSASPNDGKPKIRRRKPT